MENKPSMKIDRAFHIVILAGIYFLAAKWGLTLAFVQANATAIWPPTGIALAALLIGGWRLWPGVFLGAFLANLLTSGTVWTSLGIAAGNSLEAVAGYFLVTRLAHGREALRRSTDLYKFAFLGGMAAPVVSASIGVATLAWGGLNGNASFKDVWLTWWLGDMGGALLFAPPLLLWPGRWPSANNRSKWMEGAAFLVVFLIMDWILFGGWPSLSAQNYPLKFIFIPLLLWAAVSFNTFISALSVLAFSLVAVEGTLHGRGPFMEGTQSQSLLFLQTFMSVTSVTVLALASVVTERKMAEEELKWSHSNLQLRVLERTDELQKANFQLHQEVEQKRRLSLLVETSSDFICLTSLDGHMLYVNGSGRRLTGLEPKEDISGKIHEDFISPADRTRLRDEVVAQLVSKGHWEGEFQLCHFKTKEALPLHFTAVLIRDPATGEPQALAAIGRDTRELRKKEEELRRMALVVENSLDMILLSVPGGETLFFNRAGRRMLGIKEDADLKTLNPIDFVYPEDLETAQKVITPILMREGRWEGEFRFRNPQTGNPVYLHFTSVVMKDEKTGRPNLTASIGRDITERKKIEELARSNQELEQFAYVASHDLQEPLRMVASFVQLLARSYEGKLDQDADDYIHHAVEGVKRMQALIQDLLAYSRLGSATKPFEKVDCSEVLRQALLNLEAGLKECGAKVVFDDLPVVYGDFNQIVQLYQNLIANAVKFRGKETPKINVAAQARDGAWLFSVRDNGIGIDPQYSGQIFEIFKRLHSRSEYPGTGIGLAICKKVVTRHGGRIWVESEPGRGACFYWTMPVMKGEGT